LPLNRKHLKLY